MMIYGIYEGKCDVPRFTLDQSIDDHTQRLNTQVHSFHLFPILKNLTLIH